MFSFTRSRSRSRPKTGRLRNPDLNPTVANSRSPVFDKMQKYVPISSFIVHLNYFSFKNTCLKYLFLSDIPILC